MKSTKLFRLVPPGPPPTFGRLIHTYVKHGNREYLARLLHIWSPAIDEYHRVIGDALHKAIFIGDETAVRMLLDAGVSPTVQDSEWHTPLEMAAEAGQRSIAHLLWQHVGPEGWSAGPQTPNYLAAAAKNGHADLVADFLDMWDAWPMDQKRTALNTAAAEWRDGVLGMLLAKVPYEADAIQHALEVGVTCEPFLLPLHGRVPITTAEENLRQQRVVCQLVDAGANPEGLAYRRIPLLHAAAYIRHRIGALRALLEKGADANVQDNRGKTALHNLFQKPSFSSVDGVRVLLQHGASPELANKQGETGLHAAAYTGTLEQFQLCLATCRDADAALQLRTSHDESLLHYAAAGGREDNVHFLLTRGLDPNAANANGWTPLICALMPTSVRSCFPQCSLAHLLLEHGASAQAVTDEGWTALHALASYPSGNALLPRELWDGVAPLVRELIARGAPLDAEVGTLRSPAVTCRRFVYPNKDAWGVRMRLFTGLWGDALPLFSGPAPNTTPHMWADRNGAIEVFDAILEHWGEADGEVEG